MDPITAATTLATVIQLVGMFKQERKDGKNADHQEFIEWLEYHRHEDIKNLICNTAAIQAEVMNLLRQDNATIISKLDEINSKLAILLGQADEFKGLTAIIAPTNQLSPQAANILRQLVKSGSSYFTTLRMRVGLMLHLEKGGYIECPEPEFMEDDLNKLESEGFLICKQLSKGGSQYRITRKAAEFVSKTAA